jgi:hypothetical protein
MSQGFIQQIVPRETKIGVMYDLVIDGQKIGAGKYAPKGVEPGDYVNYDITMNGNFRNLKPGSLSKATPPAGVTAAPARSTAASAGTNSYADRQDVISKQAALNSALTFVNILTATDSLPIPASKKKDEKADIVERIVMEYTAKFYHINTGNTYELPNLGGEGGLSAAEAGDTDWSE